jgi:O-acetyl-ADP-ribose deacetylase (regulator of RNase III)
LAGALILNVFTPNFFANNKPTTSFSAKKLSKTKKIVFGTFVGAFLSGSVAVAVKLLYKCLHPNSENSNKANKIAKYRLKNGLTIEICHGEITDYKNIDMITHAVDQNLTCDCGTCGDIFKLDDENELTEEIKKKHPKSCQVGEVVVTLPTQNLKEKGFKYIAHCVMQQKPTDSSLALNLKYDFLWKIYKNIFSSAIKNKCQSLLLCFHDASLYGWSTENSTSVFATILNGKIENSKLHFDLKKIIINCSTDEEVTGVTRELDDFFKYD